MIIIYSLLLGSGIGMLTGLFGAGGGFILTPLLNAVLGLPMPLAVGTSAANVFGAATFTLAQRREITGWRVAAFMAVGIFPGTLAGAAIVEKLRERGNFIFYARSFDFAEVVLLIIFALLLAVIVGWMFYDGFLRKRKLAATTGLFAKFRVPPLGNFSTISGGEFSLSLLALVGLMMGMLSGLLGIGGGVIMLPILLYLVGQEMRAATLTNTMLVWLSGLGSTFAHWQNGNIVWAIALPSLGGVLLGSILGVRVAKKMSAEKIKRYFVVVVFFALLIVIGKLVAIFR